MLAIVEASKTAFREVLAGIRFDISSKLLSGSKLLLRSEVLGSSAVMQQSCHFRKEHTTDKSSFEAANIAFPAPPRGFSVATTLYKLTGCGMAKEHAVFVWYADYKCRTGCDCTIGSSKQRWAMISNFRAVTDKDSQGSKVTSVRAFRAAYNQYFHERSQRQRKLQATCTRAQTSRLNLAQSSTQNAEVGEATLSSGKAAAATDSASKKGSLIVTLYEKYLKAKKLEAKLPCGREGVIARCHRF